MANKGPSYYVFISLTTIALLVGRAYQHWFFDPPYRSFFLDESLFSWAVEWFSTQSWNDYTLSLRTDLLIREFSRSAGLLFFITALLVPFARTALRQLLKIMLVLSSLLLFFMSFCYYLDVGFQVGQWLEYAAQIASPLLLWMALQNWKKQSLLWLIKIAVALTFIGHGLYAFGYHPVPGNFIEMIITTLKLDNDGAVVLLKIAGVLDFLVGIGVFLPKVNRIAFFYAVVWGFLTAAARLTSYVYFNHLFWLTVHQTLFEFLIRIPHFMIPAIGFLMVRLPKRSLS